MDIKIRAFKSKERKTRSEFSRDDVITIMNTFKKGGYATKENLAKAKTVVNNSFDNLEFINEINLDSHTPQNTTGFCYIPVEALTIPYYDSILDTGAQRGYNKDNTPNNSYIAQVTAIANEFDINLMAPICVNYNTKTGIFEVYDGGHRVIAAYLKKLDRIPARVTKDLSDTEMWARYYYQDKLTTKLSPMDTFIAGIQAKVEWAENLNDVINKFGFSIKATLPGSGYPLNLRAFKTLKKYAEGSDGKEVLEYIFQFLIDLWGVSETKAFHQEWLKTAFVTYKNCHDNPALRASVIMEMKSKGSPDKCMDYADQEFSGEGSRGQNGEGHLLLWASVLSGNVPNPKKTKVSDED